MASLVIRNIDEGLKARLRVMAAQAGRSMEDEVREILKGALAMQRGGVRGLAKAIRGRFAEGGSTALRGELRAELPAVERKMVSEPPEFD
jgi:plasmid stability protein